MPILRIGLVVRILHERVILQNALPVFIVLAVGRVLPKELLYCDLMAVEVLKDEVVELRCLVLLAELDLDVRLAWPCRFRILLIRNMAVRLNNIELLVLAGPEARVSAKSSHESGC